MLRSYLVDAELALTAGLTDYIFPRASQPLEGDRLRAMRRWLTTQATAFPRSEVRSRVSSLRKKLAHKNRWSRTEYERAVSASGFSLVPPLDNAWRWCSPVGERHASHLWFVYEIYENESSARLHTSPYKAF